MNVGVEDYVTTESGSPGFLPHVLTQKSTASEDSIIPAVQRRAANLLEENFAHLRGQSKCLRNSRVFRNQMWKDIQRTKADPKTSSEQSANFQLVRDINKTNVLTKFHDDAKMKTAPPTPCNINKTNVFTKFHDDWAKKVTSRVFTIFYTI
ncbi:hypothetical protein DPMN_012379 [Dreissena polymorpha]|uniref:Uncharacterized protein n=1 Tax=Dreissena polymorpha TaxID=45954 RepID=A0A9D4S1A7_DREPO|nr:hypothetical protein DPMN_012379 [Dreissena polymorpha]